MYSLKQQKRRGTEKTQRSSSQVPHKLGEIEKCFLDERLCEPQDVLSQPDVQAAGLMTKC